MARMPQVFITREWRIPKAMYGLFSLEFLLTIAMLTLFGIADPNTYRTKLWQDGSDQGYNSNPNEILYSYANYKPISVPLVWSQYMTNFNVVISVLSMFILLVKTTMFVMHIFIPLLSLLVHGLLIALYAVSVRNQSAPDMSDPQHPSPGLPWYLSKGCSGAKPENKGYCMQARASFAVACVMLALFCVYFFYSVWSLFPTHHERSERQADIEMKKLGEYSPDAMSREEQRDINRQIFLNLPKTPTTPWGRNNVNPMTPRTVAFTQLNGGASSSDKPMSSGQGPSRALPFREHYGRTPDGS